MVLMEIWFLKVLLGTVSYFTCFFFGFGPSTRLSFKGFSLCGLIDVSRTYASGKGLKPAGGSSNFLASTDDVCQLLLGREGTLSSAVMLADLILAR